jgi:hypothetical protein
MVLPKNAIFYVVEGCKLKFLPVVRFAVLSQEQMEELGDGVDAKNELNFHLLGKKVS